MSSSSQQEITCPKCNKTCNFLMWRSINTTLDPDMKQSVRDGSAFLFTCPHCGNITHVEYDFLYHQMEDQIMIQVATTEESAQEVMEMLSDDQLADMMKDYMESHYLTRVVRSQNELREKLAILDNGLDDRIMEIYKVFLLALYQEKNLMLRKSSCYIFTKTIRIRGSRFLRMINPLEHSSFRSMHISMFLIRIYLP